MQTASIGGNAAHRNLHEFAAAAEVLEPSEEESQLAARLEEAALEATLQLDVGESQLCAIVVSRNIPILCTGDKRGIRAIERLSLTFAELACLAGRVLPLECLILRMLAILQYIELRGTICASRGTDRAIEICFQCHQGEGEEQEAIAGLESYINNIAKDAAKVLSR